MSEVTVSQKGWVVIPANLRAKYGWKPGHRVRVVDYGGVISLVSVLKDPEGDGMGSLHEPGRRLVTALARARREDRRRERRRE